MNIPKLNHKCEDFKLYYYDFLFQKDKSQIPESVLNHLKSCKNCQNKMYNLKKSLIQAEFTDHLAGNNHGTPLSNMLKLHFSYVDQNVTCKAVRPFLPGLLEPSMHLSIPTPITAHIDHCPDCVNDLKQIGDLNLNEVNLLRLWRLFASKPDDKVITCSQAGSHIMAFVMLAFQESDEQTLNHLYSCKACQTAIHQYRESIREELLRKKENQQCYLSGALSSNELFDLTIPYGIDIAQYGKSESSQSRASHMRHCPFCLEKIQEFHSTIFDIAGRADSSIITKYNVAESSSYANADSSEGLYSDFPIHVEVSGAKRKTKAASNGSVINFTEVRKNNILTSKIKSFSKVGIAGLFIIAAFTALLFYSPNAKAITLSQLYTALDKINNIHVSSYIPGKAEPVQEAWLSRSINVQILKTNNTLVLHDINGKQTYAKDAGSDTITSPLDPKALENIKNSMRNSFDLTPFQSFSDVPQDAVWEKVADESNDNVTVYELRWNSSAFYDEQILGKLRFMFKTNTNLPIRIDFYRKLNYESEYILESFKNIDFPNDGEITLIQKQVF